MWQKKQLTQNETENGENYTLFVLYDRVTGRSGLPVPLSSNVDNIDAFAARELGVYANRDHQLLKIGTYNNKTMQMDLLKVPEMVPMAKYGEALRAELQGR